MLVVGLLHDATEDLSIWEHRKTSISKACATGGFGYISLIHESASKLRYIDRCSCLDFCDNQLQRFCKKVCCTFSKSFIPYHDKAKNLLFGNSTGKNLPFLEILGGVFYR